MTYAFGKGFAGAFKHKDSKAPFHPDSLLDDGVSIEEAAKLRGMNFQLKETDDLCLINGSLHATGKKVVYRDDRQSPVIIGVVGTDYKLVQPMEILETHRKVLDVGGYHLRSCGTFKEGARFWSMAEGHGEVSISGVDPVKSYLFMASAADGSSSTYAIGTSLRGNCWNQAPAMIADAKNNGKFIRVTHSQVFNAEEARIQIQANDENFLRWAEDAQQLAKMKIDSDKALEYFAQVFDVEEEDAVENKRINTCLELFQGAGMGSQLISTKDTVWGAFNAITEYLDHHAKTESSESRLMNVTMGNGLRLKSKAWNAAKEL